MVQKRKPKALFRATNRLRSRVTFESHRCLRQARSRARASLELALIAALKRAESESHAQVSNASHAATV